MTNEPRRPTASTNLNLPLDLLERVKDAARQRALIEHRHIPYVEMVREALEKCFPAQKPGEPGTN